MTKENLLEINSNVSRIQLEKDKQALEAALQSLYQDKQSRHQSYTVKEGLLLGLGILLFILGAVTLGLCCAFPAFITFFPIALPFLIGGIVCTALGISFRQDPSDSNTDLIQSTEANIQQFTLDVASLDNDIDHEDQLITTIVNTSDMSLPSMPISIGTSKLSFLADTTTLSNIQLDGDQEQWLDTPTHSPTYGH